MNEQPRVDLCSHTRRVVAGVDGNGVVQLAGPVEHEGVTWR